MRIDAHQHFWSYSASEYPWINPEWPIRRSFLPEDLKPLLAQAGFDACIAVQARQTLEETRWLLELAREHSFIAGVVGWVDLRHENVARDLAALSHEKRLVGVRHVVQDEQDDQFMLGANFQRGIRELKAFDLAYDILIYPRQLPAAIELVRAFPEQRFVLDHIAKPTIAEQVFEPWKSQITELARSNNVMCKISGMVTEARWNNWSAQDFRPYLDTVWAAFGEERLMVGSDWPVCLNGAASYSAVMRLALDYLNQFPIETRQKVLGGNARKFYKVSDVC